ncbi:MAG: efflux RND transporter periplasmic adaptor subunit [Planctomycetota bacterium]
MSQTTPAAPEPALGGVAQKPPEKQPAPGKPSPPAPAGLVKRLEECTSLRSAYNAGLAYLAECFESPYVAMRLDVDNGSAEESVSANDSAKQSWARHCEGMLLSSRYHQTSQARFFRSAGVDRTFAILAVPLENKVDGGIGSVAVVLPCERRDMASARLSELHAIVGMIDLQAEACRRRSRPSPQASVLAKVAAHQSLEEFCFALTNSLKTNLNCDQVALGLVRGKSVRLACVSGFDDLYPRSPGSQLIQQSMCECLDAGEVVCFQSENEKNGARVTTGHHLHKQWYASLGASPVASIPLFVQDNCVAVVSLRNPGGSPFKRDQLAKVQELVAPMMTGLLLLERANRSAVRRAGDAAGRFLQGFVEPGSTKRKAMAAALLLAAAWVAFGKIEYRLAAPCLVETTGDLQLSAPFEGAIAASLVQPGDRVTEGQLLARMDTQTLQAEREKLRSELRRARVITRQASMAGDVAQAAQAHSEAGIAEAQLKITEQKIAAAEIRAPAAGVILEGRLEPRLGEVVTLGEPLLRFAPQGQWKINVHVPEHSAAELAAGQVATAAISARPEVANQLRITQVQAASQVEGGKNVFTAEAEFAEAPPEWLRAGMRGVARVDAGRRPVWWVWAHRVIDSARLNLWKL